MRSFFNTASLLLLASRGAYSFVVPGKQVSILVHGSPWRQNTPIPPTGRHYVAQRFDDDSLLTQIARDDSAPVVDLSLDPLEVMVFLASAMLALSLFANTGGSGVIVQSSESSTNGIKQETIQRRQPDYEYFEDTTSTFIDSSAGFFFF
eukprot:CAMPEP_0172492136 /NCGR_PEP_ID=MMETSP1066-20121228/23165_1 /TAXON_ID=671091 /ORGANISM="Coscinodiscus wailesii, Strain CCMP2513" /LENGTH=148 /DNA_ID=CAMNT_0013261587 /DNA_START=66 /DNA_END=512 /DNA_ORIENTATION=+